MHRPPSTFASVLLVSLCAACAGSGPRTANQSAGGSPSTGGTSTGGSGGKGTGHAGSAGAAASHAGGSDAGAPIDAGDLALDLTARFPAADAPAVCVDAPLRLDFAAPVTLGKIGKIQVFSTADPTTPVDAIDMAAQTTTDTIAGRLFIKQRPVFLDGQAAIVYLKTHALAANQTYFVTVDPTVFLDASGNPLGSVRGDSAWRFTTGSGVPADASAINVALDGSGDFCSVQGAVDAVPATSTTPVTIQLKNGTYREIVFINGKNNLTLHGEDRKQTIIAYANNDTLQNKGGTKVRAMFSAESVQDLSIDNLTFHNLTPQGGSQAEALRIDPGTRVAVRHVDVLSYQDTLLLSGTVYFSDCYVEGNVDFIWGKGTAYFERCELKTVVRAGYEVQARNTINYGYIFVDSKLTSDTGITSNYLGRIEVDRFPQSNVAYVNCQMGPHIAPAGWFLTSGTDVSQLRFWEYKSTDLAGTPLDVSQRAAFSKQLSDADAATVRDKATVLNGWAPTP